MSFEPLEVLRGSWSIAEAITNTAGKPGWRILQLKDGNKWGPQVYTDRDRCASDCERLNAGDAA